MFWNETLLSWLQWNTQAASWQLYLFVFLFSESESESWFFHKYCYSFLSMQESQWKQIHLVGRSWPANFKHPFHRWCKQITMWCKSLMLEKYISFLRKWFFSPPFLSVSPFLLLNLVRRQCYAYAIGLYTRPEIKTWPDVKFCAHAQCVLPRCYVNLI